MCSKRRNRRRRPAWKIPARQATLYACMAYSVDRLSDDLREALRRLSVFSSPFIG